MPTVTTFSLQTLLERLLFFGGPRETVVLQTPLPDCKEGVNPSTTLPKDVDLDVTGSVSVGTGVTSLMIVVAKLNPMTGLFDIPVPSTTSVTGTTTTVTILAGDHGVTKDTGCATFFLQYKATYSGGRAVFFGGQSFEICPSCSNSPGPLPLTASAKAAKPKKK